MSNSRSRSKSRSQEQMFSGWQRSESPPLTESQRRAFQRSMDRLDVLAEFRREQEAAAFRDAERNLRSNMDSVGRDLGIQGALSPFRAAERIGQVAEAAAIAAAAPSRSVSVEPSHSRSRSRPPARPLGLIMPFVRQELQVEGVNEDYGQDDMGLAAAAVNSGIPQAEVAAALAAIAAPQVAPAPRRRAAAAPAPRADGPAVDKSFVLNISKKDWTELRAMNPVPELDMFKKAGLTIANGRIRATDTARVRVWSDDYTKVLPPAQQSLDDRQVGVKTGRPKKQRADATYADYAARQKKAQKKVLSEAEWRASTGYSTDDDQAMAPPPPGGAARGRGRFNLISFRR
jgi:hypothetical protein